MFHFQEVEVAVTIDDELDCPGGTVIDSLRQCHGLLAHRLAGGFVKKRAGRFLDDFLVAPLDRALAFAQVDAVAVLVAQHLDLDMARLGDELLDEDPVIAKAGRGLVLRRLETLTRFVVVPGDPHSLAAATGAGLDHHRIPDLVGDFHCLVGILDQTHVSRHGRNTGLGREFLRGDLVAHSLDCALGRTDEGHARRVQRLGELGAFGQEAVAGMHCFRAAGPDRLHDLFDHDIGLVRRRRADVDRLVGHLDMQRVAICVGVDRDRPDAHAPCGLDNAAGDLAPVCDQDLVEHQSSPRPLRGARMA